MSETDPVIHWLMDGDPAIRWQTLRDLLDAPEGDWLAERARTLENGWGARLLALQAPDGSWGGGLYSPKWISTTYTMLTLTGIGIPGDHEPARRGAQLLLDRMLGVAVDDRFLKNLARCDRCIVGMLLQIAVYFGLDDERIPAMVHNLLSEIMPDGAWNCMRSHPSRPHHSSFHTTFNVLEGLRTYLELGNPSPDLRQAVLKAEHDALEFALQHRLYRSSRTGQVIHQNFTYLSYPPRWYYNVLRGLEFFAGAGAPLEERLQDAIDLLHRRRRRDGLWPVQHKYSGRVFFDMEKTGEPSRWNTLRALRVLRWWHGGRAFNPEVVD